VLNDKQIEQITTFKCLEYNINLNHVNNFNDFSMKLSYFQYMFGTIKRMLGGRERTKTLLKFYKVMAIPTLLYISE
jgi:hypothetical protein